MTISKIAKFLNTSEKEILSILNESIKNNNANLELKIIIKKLARNNKV
ncbi:MAG: hypothetical protein LBU14_05735 [Candidatus Peribacteria bacterium]|jgi:hypothetical protein|nr:hypothetical protein [Candidatus Peribacteria bacterium]